MDDPNRNAGSAAEYASKAGRQFRDGQGADRGPEVLACADRGVAKGATEDTKSVGCNPGTGRHRNRRVKEKTLTQERLKELLAYDVETGVFTFRKNRCNQKAGSRAGYQRADRYRSITVDYQRFLEHRLAYLYVFGFIPKEIDHIDCDPSNNAIANLRECTRAENKRNVKLTKRNTSGFKGVYRFGKTERCWKACIRHNGESIHIGSYRSADEAHAAYVAKTAELFGDFARAG